MMGDIPALLAGLLAQPLAQALGGIQTFLPIAGQLAAVAVATELPCGCVILACMPIRWKTATATSRYVAYAPPA